MHLLCPPNFLHKHCFQFLLGRLQYPRKMKKVTEDFFWGGGGAGRSQIRCTMGKVEVANRLLYPGHTCFRPQSLSFLFSLVALATMSVTHTCRARAVKNADSKRNCFELELRWQRVGREEALQWYAFIYSVYCQYWVDFAASLGQRLKHCVVNCILWKINCYNSIFFFSNEK